MKMKNKMITVGDFKFLEEDKKSIKEIMDSNRVSEHKKTLEFENNWSKYIDTKHCIGVNSGTSALIAGIHAMILKRKLNAEDKIITSPLTYPATVNAIMLNGLEPYFVDVDLDTFGILPEEIENVYKIYDNPVGIIPVHLMGYPCEIDKIKRIADINNAFVIEDTSQAHGTTYKGKKLGSFGDASTFSFYVAHNISVGELGAVNSDDKEFISLIRSIKANGRMCNCKVCTLNKGYCPKDGQNPRFSQQYIGYNFKTNEFMSALATNRIKNADKIKQKRLENVKYLNEGLKDVSFIKIPKCDENVSYLAYPIICKDINREKFMKYLYENGIESRPLFGCITEQPAYSFLKEKYKDKLPNAKYLGKNGMYIGVHEHLTKEDLDKIIKVIKNI